MLLLLGSWDNINRHIASVFKSSFLSKLFINSKYKEKFIFWFVVIKEGFNISLKSINIFSVFFGVFVLDEDVFVFVFDVVDDFDDDVDVLVLIDEEFFDDFSGFDVF